MLNNIGWSLPASFGNNFRVSEFVFKGFEWVPPSSASLFRMNEE